MFRFSLQPRLQKDEENVPIGGEILWRGQSAKQNKNVFPILPNIFLQGKTVRAQKLATVAIRQFVGKFGKTAGILLRRRKARVFRQFAVRNGGTSATDNRN